MTDELVRRYSRRGNFHSEPRPRESLGLPGLVAQGTQVTGPAYGLLLDAWGETFLARGELDVRFVGMTVAGDTVDRHRAAHDDRTRRSRSSTDEREAPRRGRSATASSGSRRPAAG